MAMIYIIPPPPPSGFTPVSLPNLLTWYKADAGVFSDAGVTPATNGQNVQQWNDNSGNSYHLSNNTGTGVVYRTNQLNGLPILDNDGTRALSMAGNPIALGGTVLSTFVVIKYTAAGGGSQRLVSVGNGNVDTSSDGFAVYENNSLTDVRTYNNGDVGVVTVSSGAWNQLGTIFNGANNTMYVANVAGTPVASTPTFNAAVNLGITCGCGNNASALTGLVAEVVITKSALNSTNRSSLAAYFLSRWGI